MDVQAVFCQSNLASCQQPSPVGMTNGPLAHPPPPRRALTRPMDETRVRSCSGLATTSPSGSIARTIRFDDDDARHGIAIQLKSPKWGARVCDWLFQAQSPIMARGQSPRNCMTTDLLIPNPGVDGRGWWSGIPPIGLTAAAASADLAKLSGRAHSGGQRCSVPPFITNQDGCEAGLAVGTVRSAARRLRDGNYLGSEQNDAPRARDPFRGRTMLLSVSRAGMGATAIGSEPGDKTHRDGDSRADN